MSDPLAPVPRDPGGSTRLEPGGVSTQSQGRAESFRAITELLRWAYGGVRHPEPASTQRDPGLDDGRPRPSFDVTEWEERLDVSLSVSGGHLGRFTIGRELGRGGFGIVYLAFDTRLGRDVALKVPRPDRVQNVAIWARFAREARLAASLNHESIVPVLDAGVIDGTFYLATAFQDGEPLSRWLARSPGGVSPRAAATVMTAIVSGLAYAHGRGVLHRDLKPGNVLMVSGDGDPTPRPRITDFGLGTFHDEDESGSLTGFWLGTPPYMAPEQVLPDRGPVDARADIYALGAILYELLTGRPVYRCRTIWELSVQLGRGDPPIPPRQLRRDIPLDLETICLKCLDHASDRRYRSASELHEDLSRFLRGEPVLARPRPAWARLGLWARRHPSRAGLMGGTAAAFLLIGWLVSRHESRLKESNAQHNHTNRELKSIVAELDATNRRLRSTMDKLRDTQLAEQHALYAADLRLATREIEVGKVESAQTSLRRQRPAPGQADLREFAWRLLRDRATRPYEVSPLRDFSWWKKSTVPPTASPLAYRFDHLLDGVLTLDPRGLTSASDRETARLDAGYRRFFISGNEDRPPDSLWYDDGWRRIPLGIPGARPLIGPDGRTLALSDPDWVVTGREPSAPRIYPLGPDPAPKPAGSGWRDVMSPDVTRIVEVPAAIDMAFSGDGRRLAILAQASDSSVYPIFYDLEAGRHAAFPARAYDPRVGRKIPGLANPRDCGLMTEIVLSRDGSLAARIDWDSRVIVSDTLNGETRWALDGKAFGAGAVVTCLAFSPDDKVLITGDSVGDVRVWDGADGAPLARFPINLGYVRAVGWYPDERTAAIIAGGEDAIRLWKYAPEPPPPATMGHGAEVWDLAFLDGGARLVSAGDDGHIRFWDASSCRPLGSLDVRTDLVSTMAVGEGEQRLYSGDYGGRVGEFAIRGGAGQEGTTIAGPLFQGDAIRALASSPDGRFLVAGGRSNSLWIRDMLDGRDRSLATPHLRNLYAIAFSPDGRILAVGSDDRSISLWNIPSFTVRANLPSRGQITCLAFTPDSHRIAAGDSEGRIQFWDVADSSQVGIVERATEVGGVWDIAFSPDGRTLASGGDDTTVRLWDPGSVRELTRLAGHSKKVHAVAFSPDGRTLASADFAGLILLHRAGPLDDRPLP